MIKETEQPLQSGIRVLVDMLRHVIIHERIVFVANHAATISNLRDIAGSPATIFASVMPHLIVEHNDASGFPQVVTDFGPSIPCFQGRAAGWRRTDEIPESPRYRRI